MIRRKTVLILGSGASKPYRFPLGRGLMNEILFYLDKKNQNNWFNKLRELEIEDEDYISNFHNELFYSGRKSVDKFLEHRTEFLEIGKITIALALIPYENKDILFDIQVREDSWYEYLFDKLDAPIDLFEQNKLSIITFNYDRSFEQYLFTVIKHSYPISEEKCINMLNNISIIHVHGRLGALPWQKGPGRPYKTKATLNQIKIASEQIMVISEKIDTSPEFEKAFRLMENADKIYFLGFGYDDLNLSRLKIDKVTNKVIVGTSYGLGKTEVRSIKGKWRNISFPNSSYKILEFLKNTVPLE